MSRSFFSLRRRLYVIGGFLFIILYLFFSGKLGGFSDHHQINYPEYVLTEGYAQRPMLQQSQLYFPVNISTPTKTFTYITSSFRTNLDYLNDILKFNGYVANVLGEEFAFFNESSNSRSSPFTCRCGRVSDPCICCGKLLPYITDKSRLAPDLYQPAILAQDPMSRDAAVFCLNTTYLPKRKQIRTSSIMLRSDYLNLNNSFGEKTQEISTNNSSLVVFDTLFLISTSKPVICSGSSNSNIFVDLCVHFTSLEYKFDPDSDHKTLFEGCVYIQIVLQRSYIITKYPKFCFQAYRGAIGDADQLSEQKVNEIEKSTTKKILSPILPPVLEAMNLENKTVSNINNSKLTQQIPSLSDAEQKVILPLPDAHEIHRGVP